MTVADSLGSLDWEFAHADTRAFTHNIHRYSGKFIPQIARQAIELLTRPGDLIVDPYCGSGTAILEGALCGRRTAGFDLNPLAVLIAGAKCRRVEPGALVRVRQRLLDVVTRIRDVEGELRTVAEADPRSRQEWFSKWFQPHVLRELLIIDAAICRVEDQAIRHICMVALSDILRKSSNAHSHYANVMFDQKAPRRSSPVEPFAHRLMQVTDAVMALPESIAEADITIARADARALPLPDRVADAVITHPPYIGSIPYAEYGVLSLRWMGHDAGVLDRELTGGRRQTRDVVQRFRDGYHGMLTESSRVLKSGGNLFVMVGNPTVRGEVIDLAEMTKELAQQAGLDIVATTRRQGSNRRANKMGHETLMVLRSR